MKTKEELIAEIRAMSNERYADAWLRLATIVEKPGKSVKLR